MAPTKILWIDDDHDDIPLHVIGIRMQCELYKAAFSINRRLTLRLAWDETPLWAKQKKEHIPFERFVYTDPDRDIQWQLVANRSLVEAEPLPPNAPAVLFQNFLAQSTQWHLVSDMKSIDSWLIIPQAAEGEMSTWVDALSAIPDFLYLNPLQEGGTKQHVQALISA